MTLTKVQYVDGGVELIQDTGQFPSVYYVDGGFYFAHEISYFATDLVIPDSIGFSGFASDGAWHLDADSGLYIRQDWDRDRIDPNVVIHTPLFKYHNNLNALIGHWKCDDNSASTTIVDSSGNGYDGVLTGGNTTNNLSSTDSIRGRSLLGDGTDDYINLSTAFTNLADDSEFTIILNFKPNFSYDVGADECLLGVGVDSNDRIFINYTAASDFIRLYHAQTGSSITTSAYTSDNDFVRWHTLRFVYSISSKKIMLWIDEDYIGDIDISNNDWVDAPTSFCVLSRYTGLDEGAYYIDEIKLLDGCILPYGCIPTGYDQNGNYDYADSDITFYWKGNDVTATNVEIGGVQGTKGGSGGTFQSGGGWGAGTYFDTEGTAELHFSVTAEDIIDFSIGKILIPFSVATISDGDYIFGVGDADDNIMAVMDASGNIDVTYESQGTLETVTGDIACGAGEIHFLEVSFNDTGNVSVFIDGIESGTAQAIANTWGGETSYTFYLGADYSGGNIADLHIYGMFITSNKNTPQDWTNFGREMWMWQMKIDGVQQQIGNGYRPIWLPDGTQLITDAGNVHD